MSELEDDHTLDQRVHVDTRETVSLAFDQKAKDHMQGIVESSFVLNKQVTDNEAFGKALSVRELVRPQRSRLPGETKPDSESTAREE